MGIFSEELRELDRNTVQLMIDEMREEIELLDMQIASNDAKIKSLDMKIAARNAEIEARKREIAAKEKELMLLSDRIRERGEQQIMEAK